MQKKFQIIDHSLEEYMHTTKIPKKVLEEIPQ